MPAFSRTSTSCHRCRVFRSGRVVPGQAVDQANTGTAAENTLQIDPRLAVHAPHRDRFQRGEKTIRFRWPLILDGAHDNVLSSLMPSPALVQHVNVFPTPEEYPRKTFSRPRRALRSSACTCRSSNSGSGLPSHAGMLSFSSHHLRTLSPNHTSGSLSPIQVTFGSFTSTSGSFPIHQRPAVGQRSGCGGHSARREAFVQRKVQAENIHSRLAQNSSRAPPPSSSQAVHNQLRRHPTLLGDARSLQSLRYPE